MRKGIDVEDVTAILKEILKKQKKPIPLHEPSFCGREWAYLKDCLDAGWVSYGGQYVAEFEKRLAAYTGVKHAIAVVNGTAALHICLKYAGVKADDEVLLPALTFVATANAVDYCRAVPHFVDSDALSLGIDVKKLKAHLQDIAMLKDDICYNRKTMRPIRAIVAMHTFGHPVDLEPLVEICNEYHIALVEDAAESLGSYYKGKHTGNWGRLSALSFNGNKIVTTGGGGAVLTNEADLAEEIRHVTTTAKLPHKWAYVHDRVGYNYRMPNINAALGCGQIEGIEGFLESKRALAAKYQRAFQAVEGISFFKEPDYGVSNYWLNTLVLDEAYWDERDALLSATHREGILTRPVWTLMNKLPMYCGCPRMDLSIAERLEKAIINIPSSPHLGVDTNED